MSLAEMEREFTIERTRATVSKSLVSRP